MKPNSLTDRQRRMVLERSLDDNIIAQRLGTSPREIKRLRKALQAS